MLAFVFIAICARNNRAHNRKHIYSKHLCA